MIERTHPIIRGGEVVYKCRRCGGESNSMHCPSIVHTMSMLQRKSKAHDDPPGFVVYWQDLHRCADGRYGVSDLVGFNPDPDK